jgi:Legionella pneumophila major outer membrane protein precursor
LERQILVHLHAVERSASLRRLEGAWALYHDGEVIVRRFFLFVALLGTLTLNAWDASIWGQAIYWKPTNGGVDWITARSTQGMMDGETFRVSPDYHWGFRVGGEFQSDCSDLFVGLSGLHLRSDDSAMQEFPENIDVYSPLNFVTVQAGEVPIVATGRLATDYWHVDARVGRTIRCGCATLSPFAAARFIDIQEKYRATLVGDEIGENELGNFLADRSVSFEGAGPGLGLDGTVYIGCGFGLHMQSGLYALIGERKADWRGSFDTTEPLMPHYKLATSTIIAPAIDFDLGVSYSARWCSICWTGEVGYSLLHAWNVLNAWLTGPVGFPNGPDRKQAFPLVTRDRDFGLAGPYFSLKLTY